MAFTRAQATDLLNKAEMRLYDDSRANGLRGLDRAALAGRVERARTARDRARDLLKRQRLAARKRGEGRDEGIAARTARKEALLVEILQRFVDARRAAAPGAVRATAGRPAATKAAATKAAARSATGTAAPIKRATKKVAARKAAAKKAAGKRAATKKAASGTTATGNGAARKTPAAMESAESAPAKKAATTKASATKTASRKAATKAAARKAATKKSAPRTQASTGASRRKAASRGALSPQRALENTRSLLEAKQERDRRPQPWQSLDPVTDHTPQPGFQSPQAADKAQKLHAGESRMASIHGSMSTHDRRNQGKRDHRGDDGSGEGP